MQIGLVGSGPAMAAVEASISDLDVSTVSLSPADLDDGADPEDRPPVGVVVQPAGHSAFVAASDAFVRWVAIEIGGIGGIALDALDASVSTYSTDSGCYRCLSTRVAAGVDGSEGSDNARGDRSAVRFAGAVAGRHLVALLTGDREGGWVTEIDGPERSFLPVPGCDCEKTQRSDLLDLDADGAGDRPLDDAISRAERAVDARVGLLGEVGERESFPVPYYITTTRDTTGFSDAHAAEYAAGADIDWDRAYMKALGEGLERYAAGVYRESTFTRAPASNRTTAVSPARFVRPDASNSFEKPDPETPIRWIPGRDLATGDRVSLPAEFVMYPPPERRYKPAITTGLGLGNTPVEAILSGLYEVIERDATMIGWYSTTEPVGLNVSDDRFGDLRKRARAESLDVTAILSTQDIDVPVVSVAVHRDSGEWPAFAMGSGASLDPIEAAVSALSEALQNWMELRAMGKTKAANQGAAIGEYASFPPAAQRFVDVDTSVSADSIGAPSLDGMAELTAVVERLDAVGLDAYAARTTTRDVEALGFEAARAIVPAAQPLFTGEPFFGDRARSVPESMGFEPRLDGPYHPYP